MKQLCVSALMGSVLLFLLAPVCLAGEVLEGDGYSIRIPDGFQKALSMEGDGSMRIQSNLGCLPIDGIPETTIYIYGDSQDPLGTILVSKVGLKSGSEIDTTDELGLHQMQRMQDQMPEGFEMRPRKVGKFDAIEVTMEVEMFDEAYTARILMVAGGDSVLAVMMQVADHAFPAVDTQWEQMVTSIKIEKGLSKVVVYGGIGLGALLLVIVFARLSRGGTPEFVRLDPGESRYVPRPGTDPGMPYTPSALPPPDAQPAAPPATLPAARPAPSPSPAGQSPLGANAKPPRPPPAAPSARPGLRPTLPPSGRWES